MAVTLKREIIMPMINNSTIPRVDIALDKYNPPNAFIYLVEK